MKKAGSGPIAAPAKAPLLRRAVRQSGPFTVPPAFHEAQNSPGRPLEEATRASMESRFGHDFSQVRVHHDAKAAESAQSVNALAFTLGQNIHFDAGEYHPETLGGERLLAHELAHTIQQRNSDADFRPDTSLGPATENYRLLEHEADHAAEEVVAGRNAGIAGHIGTIAPQLQDKDKKKQPQAPKIVPPVEPGKTQKKMIDEARRAAAIRAQIAMFKASGVQGIGPFQEARRLAQIKFDWPDPNMDQISEILSGMGGGLISVEVKVAGPGDPECGNRSGYVRDHRAPIVLCPGFFADPGNNEGRIRTMIHEMAHVKGIGKASVSEEYFQIFDCTSKGSFGSADSWANYVHCLSGQTPDKPEEIVGGSKGGKPSPKKPGGGK